jgi:hypothetical protein
MLTIRDEENHLDVCGAIFWRDLLEEEMLDWTKNKKTSESAVVKKGMFGGWIKIELVCTAPAYMGRRIGIFFLFFLQFSQILLIFQ